MYYSSFGPHTLSLYFYTHFEEFLDGRQNVLVEKASEPFHSV